MTHDTIYGGENVNKYKLLGRIKECGKTADSFSKELGMARSTFSKKCNGRSEFTQSEICDIVRILALSNDDVVDIFFSQKVS